MPNQPAGAGFDSEWFHWTPSAGPLPIQFTDGQDVRSIYFPIMPMGVSFAATPTPLNGNPFYVANATGEENGAETVPLPEGTQIVTLTAASTLAYYVFASSYPYKPFKGANIMQTQTGNFSITFGSDGTATHSVVYSPGYSSGAEIAFTPKFDGVTPSGVFVGLTAESQLGCTAEFGGGNPGDTINVGFIASGVL